MSNCLYGCVPGAPNDHCGQHGLAAQLITLKADLAAALERVGESVKLIDEIDREYNQKTNALIERHAAQLDQLKRERDEAQEGWAAAEDRASIEAGCCHEERTKAKKAYRQGFEDCREAIHDHLVDVGVLVDICPAYAEIRALTVPERGQG